MKYLSVAEGRVHGGLRLVLTMGLPAPWGESAKAVLRLRNVPYVPVGQEPMGSNDDLVAWTGIRNAPIAICGDEPPVHNWYDILMLAERLGSGPSLLPVRSAERSQCLGLCMEIAAQQGFAWNARLWMLAPLMGTDPATATTPVHRNMLQQYGMSAAAAEAAPGRVADIVRNLAQQLRAQRGRGLEYLVGSRLTAIDVYWVCFSQMIAPLPQNVNPVPDYVRELYGAPPAVVAATLDPLLLEHRDRIFERHIGLPLDY